MLDMMFQHPGTVQCALFLWLGFHALYPFKETSPYFLFTKYHIFVQNQLDDDNILGFLGDVVCGS